MSAAKKKSVETGFLRSRIYAHKKSQEDAETSMLKDNEISVFFLGVLSLVYKLNSKIIWKRVINENCFATEQVSFRQFRFLISYDGRNCELISNFHLGDSEIGNKFFYFFDANY